MMDQHSQYVERKYVLRVISLADNRNLITKEDVLLTLETPHGDITDWFSIAEIPGDAFIGYSTMLAYNIIQDITKVQPASKDITTPRPPSKTKKIEHSSPRTTAVVLRSEKEQDFDTQDMDTVGEHPTNTNIEIPDSFPLKEKLSEVLEKFSDVLSEKLPESNSAGEIQISIRDDKEAPIAIPPRRTSLANEKIIEEKIKDLLRNKIIQRSRSPFSSPVVIVRKPGAEPRLCIDYRVINQRLIRPACPMKDTRTIIRNLEGNKYFGTLDLRSGFHQIKLTDDSCKYTAFATHIGLYEFLKLPFGIAIAPQEFQRIMSNILYGVHGVDVYVDDVIIAARTAEEFVSRVEETLLRLQQHNLRVKKSKCKLGEDTIVYLGHKIDGTGVQLTEDRKHAFAQLKRPTSTAEIRTFIGVTNYFRQFIENFAIIAAPLTKLTKKNQKYTWGTEQEQAYNMIKDKLINSPVLHHINYSHDIVVQSDASLNGIGAILWQQHKSTKQRFPVCYLSKQLTDQQKKWSAIEIEAYAIYYAITHWSEFLLGHPFIVETDHANLRYLEKSEAPKLVRWRLQLGNYDFVIHHIPGKSNEIADGLSRLCYISEEEDKVPDSIIQRYHNNVAGHLGVSATIKALHADGFQSKNISMEVEKFIQTCGLCQKSKSNQPTVEYDQRPTATLTPWTHISIDTLGPLPKDSDGFAYIIVVVDRFSRYLELFATKDCTARAAAKALLEVFSRYGPPQSVRSDQGNGV